MIASLTGLSVGAIHELPLPFALSLLYRDDAVLRRGLFQPLTESAQFRIYHSPCLKNDLFISLKAAHEAAVDPVLYKKGQSPAEHDRPLAENPCSVAQIKDQEIFAARCKGL